MFVAGPRRNHQVEENFRADIEGLRAIAILFVVAAHAGMPWLAGGFIGVDVFFVLSGFLITSKLVQEASATGRISLLPFYVRRLKRLLPALLLMLVVTGFAATWLLSPDNLGQQLFAAQMAALWLSNFHFALGNLDYFGAASESNLYLHTWSLSVEEQFYLLWPALILWLLARDGQRGLARLKIGMLGMTGVSLLACLLLTYSEPLLAFYMMPLRAWQFAVGALVWLVSIRAAQTDYAPPRFASALGWLGLACLLASALWLDTNRAYPGGWAILPTLSTALIVFSGNWAQGRRTSYYLLALPPLQWLGRISYSWYLWHWPVLLLGDALTGNQSPIYRAALVVVSLVLAWLSQVLVEAPLRQWRQWLAFPRMAVLASFGGMAAVGLLGSHWVRQSERILQSPNVARYAGSRGDAPIIYRMGCDDWYRSATVRVCSFGDESAANTAVMIGDSHVGQWFPAIKGALDESEWRLLVITKSSCPMVDEPFFYTRIGREYTECSQWRDSAIEHIARISPDLLLLGSANAEFTQQQWTEGTARVLARLSPASKSVFLLVDTPSLPFNGPDCLIRYAARPAWLKPSTSCSTQAISAQADDIRGWLQAAAARFPNVRQLDLNPLICPGGVCRAEMDGRIVYRDNQHLSASFAASLSPTMRSLLQQPAPYGGIERRHRIEPRQGTNIHPLGQ